MEDQIINLRLAAVEARMASLEQRLASLEQGSTAAKPRKKKDLSPEDRAAIRTRLLAGQQAKKEREAAAAAEAKKATKQKEVKSGASEAEN